MLIDEESFADFMSEMKDNLIEYFIEENQNLFNDFLQEEIIDEDRDIQYWKMQFCEENEDEFNEYCKNAFENQLDIIRTDRSLWRR